MVKPRGSVEDADSSSISPRDDPTVDEESVEKDTGEETTDDVPHDEVSGTLHVAEGSVGPSRPESASSAPSSSTDGENIIIDLPAQMGESSTGEKINVPREIKDSRKEHCSSNTTASSSSTDCRYGIRVMGEILKPNCRSLLSVPYEGVDLHIDLDRLGIRDRSLGIRLARIFEYAFNPTPDILIDREGYEESDNAEASSTSNIAGASGTSNVAGGAGVSSKKNPKKRALQLSSQGETDIKDDSTASMPNLMRNERGCEKSAGAGPSGTSNVAEGAGDSPKKLPKKRVLQWSSEEETDNEDDSKASMFNQMRNKGGCGESAGAGASGTSNVAEAAGSSSKNPLKKRAHQWSSEEESDIKDDSKASMFNQMRNKGACGESAGAGASGTSNVAGGADVSSKKNPKKRVHQWSSEEETDIEDDSKASMFNLMRNEGGCKESAAAGASSTSNVAEAAGASSKNPPKKRALQWLSEEETNIEYDSNASVFNPMRNEGGCEESASAGASGTSNGAGASGTSDGDAASGTSNDAKGAGDSEKPPKKRGFPCSLM